MAVEVPVFVASGVGGDDWAHRLLAAPEVRVVPTPRAATVLFAPGAFPGAMADALGSVHDQLPHPRVTVWWPGDAADARRPPVEDALVLDTSPSGPDFVRALMSVLDGDRDSEPDVLSDEPPADFEGKGDHGQGGEGMMGGVPYGRPMATTGDDRDGLALDRLEFRAGPFLAGFPTGFALDVVLQGGVVQEARPVFLAPAGDGTPAPVADPFVRARRERVPVAHLERARARHHLAWAARTCWASGLDAVARRAAAHAVRSGDAPAPSRALRCLRRLVAGSGLPRVWEGVGRFPASVDLEGVGGPVARAAGVNVDARNDDPAYADLAFEPVRHDGGDAAARLRQRLVEAEQALTLAARAHETGAIHEPEHPVEPLRGDFSSRVAADQFGKMLVGFDWGDTVITVLSLDLPPLVSFRRGE